MNLRPLTIAFALPFTALAEGGTVEYEVIVIEPWNQSYSLAISKVSDINNLNQVSGCATTDPLGGPCSFLWTVELDKMEIDLAGLINDAGVIVASNAVRWPDGTFQELDGAMHGAADINNANIIAGSDGSVFTCPQPPPFVNREATIWSAESGTELVEQQFGVPNADQAWAINEHNVIVGVSSSTGHCGDQKAFYYDVESGQFIDLHQILVGGPSGITHAVDVNDAGQVIGGGPVTMGGSAFLWSEKAGVSIIPDLPGTDFGYSIPSSINNDGTVVGQAIVNNEWRAWIWDADNGIRDLNEIAAGIPDNFVIEEAKKINELGWIIGRGHYGSWSPERAVVLIPIEPTVFGDLDGDGIVAVSDLLILLASWGTCAKCPADLDTDGVVGTEDLLQLLASWG